MCIHKQLLEKNNEYNPNTPMLLPAAIVAPKLYTFGIGHVHVHIIVSYVQLCYTSCTSYTSYISYKSLRFTDFTGFCFIDPDVVGSRLAGWSYQLATTHSPFVHIDFTIYTGRRQLYTYII